MTPPKSQNSKSNVRLGTGCVICEESEIIGDVTIGNGTIVHPRARIIAEGGPIILGEHNLIEDKAVIINRFDAKEGMTPIMIIGNYNVFEVGSRSEALKIGDNNILESKSVVGSEVEISNNCVIGGGCVLTYPQTLPENCAIYGHNCTKKFTQGHQPQISQMDFLSTLFPTCHRLVSKKKSSAKDSTNAI